MHTQIPNNPIFRGYRFSECHRQQNSRCSRVNIVPMEYEYAGYEHKGNFLNSVFKERTVQSQK